MRHLVALFLTLFCLPSLARQWDCVDKLLSAPFSKAIFFTEQDKADVIELDRAELLSPESQVLLLTEKADVETLILSLRSNLLPTLKENPPFFDVVPLIRKISLTTAAASVPTTMVSIVDPNLGIAIAGISLTVAAMAELSEWHMRKYAPRYQPRRQAEIDAQLDAHLHFWEPGADRHGLKITDWYFWNTAYADKAERPARLRMVTLFRGDGLPATLLVNEPGRK